MSESQFLDEIETGDLILFRGNNSGSGAQRFFTGSHFDHAALAIKDAADPKDDVTFIEAVNTGVTSNSWQQIRNEIGPDKFFEKVCIRKLKINRTKDFYNTLDDFIDETWQHDYEVFSKIGQKFV